MILVFRVNQKMNCSEAACLQCESDGIPLLGLWLGSTRCATGKQWLRYLHSNSASPKTISDEKTQENSLDLDMVMLERFSKPNFGSIRRFRTMTGLEIENWIEKTRPNRPKVSVDQAPNRIEFSIRFDLMPIAKPAFWSPVAPLSGIRQFFSRNLVKFTCVTPPRIYPKSDKAKLKLPFNQADDEFFFFTSAGTWSSSVNEWARGVGHGITSDRGLGRRSPPDLHSLTKNTSLGHKDRDFLQLDTRAAALGMQSYGRSYFCLLNVSFGCASTEISIQFSTRSFPNRIEYSVC